MPETQMSLEIIPGEEGSAAGNRQFVVAAVPGIEGMQTAERGLQKLSAEVAAAGRVTVPAVGSRGAGFGGAVVLSTAAGDMEMGTADEKAGMAAESKEAGLPGAVAAVTEAAVDRKAGHEESEMVVPGNRAAVVDEGFAGCSMDSGPAGHTRWDLVDHKEESAVHKRGCPLYSAPGPAWSWGTAEESGIHMAVLGIHVLAVVLMEVPVAVSMGYCHHMAEVSSCPSDPLDWMAAGSG